MIIIPFSLLTVYLVDLVPTPPGTEAVSDISQDFALNEGEKKKGGKFSFCDLTAVKTAAGQAKYKLSVWDLVLWYNVNLRCCN